MGSLTSCCVNDTTNRETIDIVRRNEDAKPLLDSNNLGIVGGKHHARHGSTSYSRFEMPNITIKPEPIIADHIFLYPQYLEKRQNLEHFVEDNLEIEQITYDQNEWLVFSKNSKIFDECRPLFDIIIWRLPVIQAFGKIDTDCKTYIQTMLNINENSNLMYPYDTIMLRYFYSFLFGLNLAFVFFSACSRVHLLLCFV